MSRCPICAKEALPRKDNAAAPFCSARCKMVDLGKWLSEDYRVPTDEEPELSPEAGAPKRPPEEA